MAAARKRGGPTELLARFAGGLEGFSILAVNLPEPGEVPRLASRPAEAAVTLFHHELMAHERAAAAAAHRPGRITAVFGAWHAAGGYDAAVVALPRGRDYADLVCTLAAKATRPGAPVWVVGAIRAGARSARPLLEERVGAVLREDAGRRSLLYRLRRHVAPPPRVELSDWETAADATVGGRRLALRSFPGVFSHGRLDPGTALLLESLKAEPPATRVLDLGCGCGAIGAALRLAWRRAEVTLADSNALALEAARRTLRANGLDAEDVVASDAYAGLTGKYDLIVSNPPFHAGEETDFGAAETFIREAPSHLAPGGRLRIVANRFLRYPQILRRAFGSLEVVASDNVYRVYEAVKAGRLTQRRAARERSGAWR